mmetsp:Transcript_25909/g.39803  ORF Transcript_25909/g.39803 Transcript_25909/m.39803 type:complete len:556 (-) Transcript_25909:1243-2910(-)
MGFQTLFGLLRLRGRYLIQTCLLSTLLLGAFASNAHHSFHQGANLATFRGGSTSAFNSKSKFKENTNNSNAFRLLALALKDRLAVAEGEDRSAPQVKDIEKALSSLSSSQGALKSLDGTAYEAYQRTHKNTESVDVSVSGRAGRSAARAGCTADALLTAELCELIDKVELLDEEKINDVNATLYGRELLINTTTVNAGGMNLTLLVLYEPMYCGGAGLDHGGINDLQRTSSSDDRETPPRGRLLVIVGDALSSDLPRAISLLDEAPLLVGLSTGLVANEVVSVQEKLYKAAGDILEALRPTLQSYNSTDMAVHFVGRSLAGGVASLAATILDGSLPMPGKSANKKRRRKKRQRDSSKTSNREGESDEASGKNETNIVLEGFGQGRCSAVSLGGPPCLSSNLKASFVTSIIYGDDVICRTTRESIDRLCQRTRKVLKGGILGRQLGWMTDAVSLTVSSLKDHAHGSEGEEARLAVPGQVYLVRPRKLGGKSSMHEVGGLKGGREALRAAVLWQLHDVLLSKSMWRHHSLDSYIHGLDRVQLRGFDDGDTQNEQSLY